MTNPSTKSQVVHVDENDSLSTMASTHPRNFRAAQPGSTASLIGAATLAFRGVSASTSRVTAEGNQTSLVSPVKFSGDAGAYASPFAYFTEAVSGCDEEEDHQLDPQVEDHEFDPQAEDYQLDPEAEDIFRRHGFGIGVGVEERVPVVDEDIEEEAEEEAEEEEEEEEEEASIPMEDIKFQYPDTMCVEAEGGDFGADHFQDYDEMDELVMECEDKSDEEMVDEALAQHQEEYYYSIEERMLRQWEQVHQGDHHNNNQNGQEQEQEQEQPAQLPVDPWESSQLFEITNELSSLAVDEEVEMTDPVDTIVVPGDFTAQVWASYHPPPANNHPWAPPLLVEEDVEMEGSVEPIVVLAIGATTTTTTAAEEDWASSQLLSPTNELWASSLAVDQEVEMEDPQPPKPSLAKKAKKAWPRYNVRPVAGVSRLFSEAFPENEPDTLLSGPSKRQKRFLGSVRPLPVPHANNLPPVVAIPTVLPPPPSNPAPLLSLIRFLSPPRRLGPAIKNSSPILGSDRISSPDSEPVCTITKPLSSPSPLPSPPSPEASRSPWSRSTPGPDTGRLPVQSPVNGEREGLWRVSNTVVTKMTKTATTTTGDTRTVTTTVTTTTTTTETRRCLDVGSELGEAPPAYYGGGKVREDEEERLATRPGDGYQEADGYRAIVSFVQPEVR